MTTSQRILFRKIIISVFILIIILLLLLFLKTGKPVLNNYEGFKSAPKWIKTMRCLRLDDQKNLDKIKKMMQNGEDPNIALNKIILMAKKKDLEDREIFDCLIP